MRRRSSPALCASPGSPIVSNANNHFFDFFQAGEDDTVRALHRAGIAQTGMPGEITIMHVKDFRIAFLGFAPYPNTGSLTDLRGRPPADPPGLRRRPTSSWSPSTRGPRAPRPST